MQSRLLLPIPLVARLGTCYNLSREEWGENMARCCKAVHRVGGGGGGGGADKVLCEGGG